MGSIKALTMAGMVVAFGAIAPASAADLLPPPPHIEPAPIIVETSGWYLRGDVGVGINQMSSLRSSFSSVDLAGAAWPPPGLVMTNGNNAIGDSAVIDFGVGYQINNWFRADVTLGYHSSTSYSNTTLYGPLAMCGFAAPAQYCYDNYSARLNSFHGLINGYVDLGTWAGVTPYLGAGIGFANIRMTGITDVGAQSSVGYGSNISQTNFAWALMAGLGYNVNERLKLEMGYRYLNQGTVTSAPIICNSPNGCALERQSFKLTSQDLRIGMRWMLGEQTAAPVMAASAPIFGGRPGPLVRKY